MDLVFVCKPAGFLSKLFPSSIMSEIRQKCLEIEISVLMFLLWKKKNQPKTQEFFVKSCYQKKKIHASLIASFNSCSFVKKKILLDILF